MADGLTPEPTVTPELSERAEPMAPSFPPGKRSALYTHRFGLAYALLAAVVGLAIGGFVVLAGRATQGPGPQWSSWKPSDNGQQGALEIANHISSRYKLPDGGKLVGVLAGTPNVQNVPIGHIALAKDTSGQNFDVLAAGKTLEYQLCGLGPACAIRQGTATVERGLLLHRQAVELALYTFKYVHGTDSVLTLLPPKPGKRPTLALFFRKDDFKSQLSEPIGRTLSPRQTLMPQDLNRRDLTAIASLTRDHVFQYTFQQAQDRSIVMILAPLSV